MSRIHDALAAYRGLFDARVWILSYGQVVQSAGRGMLMPFMALYFYNVLGFPLTTLGVAWALSAALGFFSSIVGGAYADRTGRRPIMLVGLLANGASVLAFAFVESIPQFFAASIAQGLVGSMFPVGSRAAVADMTPRDRRVRAYGLLYMANNFGMSAGLLLGGVLIAFLPYRALFYFEAAAHLAFFFVVLVGVPETFRGKGVNETPLANARQILRDFRIPLRDGAFLAFIGVDILAAFGMSTFYNVLTPYMKNYAGLPDSLIGPLVAINTVMVVVLQAPLAAYAERRRKSTVLLQASYLLGWSLLAFWLAAQLRLQGVATVTVLMGVAMAIYTLAEILRVPVVPALVSDLAPSPDAYGKYLGFMDVIWIVGGGVGSVVGGLFFDAGRAGLIWPTFTLFALLNMVGILLIRPYLAARIARGKAEKDAAEAAAAAST